MKILISWAHSDCTYSLLKVLELIPNAEVYVADKVLPNFITFLLDYNEWPINQFRQIIKPLSSLKTINEIDYYFAEIMNLQWDKNGKFTDSQIEWGINNLDKSKIILYSYNVITFEKFKYKHLFPLISTSLSSYLTYGGPKHFFHGDVQILPYSSPKKFKSLFLIQNSYEEQKKSKPIFVSLLKNPLFSDYDIRYYGHTDSDELKNINYCKGRRLSRKEINRLIMEQMTFSLHLKDVEGYGYHPLKCMHAGRPVINLKSNISKMTYESYMVNDITALVLDNINDLFSYLNFYSTKDKITRFSKRCAEYVRNEFDFQNENRKTSDFLKSILS